MLTLTDFGAFRLGTTSTDLNNMSTKTEMNEDYRQPDAGAHVPNETTASGPLPPTAPATVAPSDTPETDRLEYDQECGFEVCWEEHSRKLERERNRLRKTIADLAYLSQDRQTTRIKLRNRLLYALPNIQDEPRRLPAWLR